ncbi:MAG: zf-HC2 domain-containing protein [Treponema sp.]|jgi:anti-sigma factor RsiW|nr:zf-HC2 domain-containing protein [Treponema sp.]
MMCPDRQILSVYFDGELPSPWREKMEAHLASCAACTAILKQYDLCSTMLKKGEDSPFKSYPTGNIPAKTTGEGEFLSSAFKDNMELARERIWRKLPPPRGIGRPDRAIWQRKVSLPLPAAAAAAVLFLVLAAALLRQPVQSSAQQDLMAGGMGLNMQDIVPVSDMDEVLQYFGNQDSNDMVIIRLPESKSFISSGEPTMIKAADYSRRNQGR